MQTNHKRMCPNWRGLPTHINNINDYSYSILSGIINRAISSDCFVTNLSIVGLEELQHIVLYRLDEVNHRMIYLVVYLDSKNEAIMPEEYYKDSQAHSIDYLRMSKLRYVVHQYKVMQIRDIKSIKDNKIYLKKPVYNYFDNLYNPIFNTKPYYEAFLNSDPYRPISIYFEEEYQLQAFLDKRKSRIHINDKKYWQKAGRFTKSFFMLHYDFIPDYITVEESFYPGFEQRVFYSDFLGPSFKTTINNVSV